MLSWLAIIQEKKHILIALRTQKSEKWKKKKMNFITFQKLFQRLKNTVEEWDTHTHKKRKHMQASVIEIVLIDHFQ